MREAVSAVDDRVGEALNRAIESLREQLDATLSSCRDELSRVAAEEGARAAANAAESATQEARRNADRQMTEWRETAAREAEERERDSDARVRQAEAREHDAEAREREADAQRHEFAARVEASERITEELRRSLDEARRLLDEVRVKGERDVEAARQEAEQGRRKLDEWLKDVEGFKEEVRGFQEALAEAAAQAARLPDAIRTLDRAASLGEALDALVRCAAREAERAAVFLVKGTRLCNWRVVGFTGIATPIEMSTDEPGLFCDAFRGERGVGRGTGLPVFADGPGARYAVTMPVRVGGAVVAVLYADAPDADKESEPVWPDRLDMLARYAGRMLESITIRQAAGLSGARPVKMAVAAAGQPPARSIQ